MIHHTQCGTAALADEAFRHRYAQRIGADASALLDHAVLDPAATVAGDVQRLLSAPAISPRISVSGHVYDVATGLVQTILPGDPNHAIEDVEREPRAYHGRNRQTADRAGSSTQ